MKTIKVSSASRPLAEYATELRKDITVLTEHHKPVTAVVPLKYVDRESLARSPHPEFLNLIAGARREFAADKTFSLEEMEKLVWSPSASNKRLGRMRGKCRSTEC